MKSFSPRRTNHVGCLLYRCRCRVLRAHVEIRASCGTTVEGIMEYIIPGITSAFLFIYLLYALLKPERF